MTTKQIRGYCTATCDCVTASHVAFFKWCKQQCDHLTVGLTIDSLCEKQKRVPLFSFDERRCMLESCRYVDFVVAHSGEPKALAHKQLGFDILFSGAEYMGSNEFEDFQRDVPYIPVRYFPRYPDISSTAIIKHIMQRFIDSQQIIAPSINGSVTRFGLGPYYVSKPIHFANRECNNTNTSDIFGFFKHFDQLPRNWKSESHASVTSSLPTFPLISGINSNRELAINILLQDKPWCTYVSSKTVYEEPARQHTSYEDEKFDTLLDFANFVSRARQHPAKIVNLVQTDSGITFEAWCDTVCKTTAEFQAKVNYIENVIITDLEREGIVHGDVHSRNLLIGIESSQKLASDKQNEASLIDFGWVSARVFDLCKKESASLEHMLQTHFDIVHFRKSMRICPATRKWLDLMSNATVVHT